MSAVAAVTPRQSRASPSTVIVWADAPVTPLTMSKLAQTHAERDAGPEVLNCRLLLNDGRAEVPVH
jgi:hypothetical protein